MKSKSKDYLCGIGSWRPKWMQWMATPSVFLVIMSITSLIQGGSYTYYIASLTTLEKRFAFSSKISGFILIADNLPELILGPVLGYLANRLHRPRILGISYVIVGLGLYLAALPYFIYGPAVHLLNADPKSLGTYSSNKTIEFCDTSNDVKNECNENSGSTTVVPAVVMLWMSSFFNGFGATAYFSMGIPFVDDSVKKKNSAIYISSTGALRVLGPMIGFLLSSLCLTFYEDPFLDPGIKDRKDPRWVGAWWIGFMVLGTVIILAALPLFLFPPELSKNLKHKPNVQKTKGLLKVTQNNETNTNPNAWIRFKRLAKNPIYLSYVMGTNARLFAVLGYWTFKSKYIESAYKKSASTANLFSGLIGVVPTATGIFLGGFFIKCFQPRARILTSFIAIVEVLALMGMFSALFLGCPQSEFAGRQADQRCVTQTVFVQRRHFNRFVDRMRGRITSLPVLPVVEYNDCECFGGTAKEGYCETDCANNFATYVTLLGISSIIGNLAKSGNSIISFRIVDPIDKSFAVALAGAFFCLFAFIPYPLVYGAVTDSTCLIWEESCGRRGNCWVYDTDKFRNYLHGMTVTLYLIGSLFDVIVVILSDRIKDLYDEDDDQGQNNDKLNRRPTNDQELESL